MRILGFRWRRMLGFRWQRALGLLLFLFGVFGVAGATWQVLPTPDRRRDEKFARSYAGAEAVQIAHAVRLFAHERHTLPDGLRQLLERSDVIEDPFLFVVPSDPWGTAFRLGVLGAGLREFEVRSAGPDRRFDTADDVVEAPR